MGRKVMKITMIDNAMWIKTTENKEEACYEFYTDIRLEKNVQRAELSMSAMGMYRAFIDEKRVGNEVFTPYFTDYSTRLQYQVYDITDMIKKDFRLSAICAEGWAVGRTWGRCNYHKNIALIFSLDIIYDDGTVFSVVSDNSINVSTSEILKSSIYDGEIVDKTAKKTELGKAEVDTDVKTYLFPQYGERVIEQEIIIPRHLITTPLGEKVIDFGQNFSGYVEIRINGSRGDKIEISHAEILDKNGNFYTDNLRSAKQRNVYILSGEGEDVLKPTFSWQGFRYVRLDSFPNNEVDLDSFRGIAVYSEMKRIGDFVCGNQKINQLYHNVIWGQRSNFIDIPTDCPQRDERMGWTGDAQVFVRTAAINYDVERFFKKWLLDLASDQRADGGVMRAVPALNSNIYDTTKSGISAAWGDAAVICPWEIYMAYGNDDVLRVQFDSMKKWIEYMHNAGEEEYLWLGGEHFGDWLAMDNGESYGGATSKDYIASAFFAYSTGLFVRAGHIIGEYMTDYEKLYKNVLCAFRKEFTKNGVPVISTQTAYAIALYFDLCENKIETAARLNELVVNNGNKLTTGFVGTPYILYALSENGYKETAINLLLQEEMPSWLYSVNKGATTMWEHWDGIKEGGELWSKAMNSFNHYAYGTVYSWIFEVVAGVKRTDDGAGYKNIIIEPYPDKRLCFAEAKINTKYGLISSSWYFCNDDSIKFKIEIPQGVSATIKLPDDRTFEIIGRQKVELKV